MKENDPRTSKYFNSLPIIVQESIMQSGMTFDNDEEIRNFVSEQEHKESLQ